MCSSDLDYFLRIDNNKKENYFPETSISKRADYLEAKKPTSIQIADKFAHLSPEKHNQLLEKLREMIANKDNQNKQIAEVRNSIPIFTKEEAKTYLDKLKKDNDLNPPAPAPSVSKAEAEIAEADDVGEDIEKDKDTLLADIYDYLKDFDYSKLTKTKKLAKQKEDAEYFLTTYAKMDKTEANKFINDNDVIATYNDLLSKPKIDMSAFASTAVSAPPISTELSDDEKIIKKIFKVLDEQVYEDDVTNNQIVANEYACAQKYLIEVEKMSKVNANKFLNANHVIKRYNELPPLTSGSGLVPKKMTYLQLRVSMIFLKLYKTQSNCLALIMNLTSLISKVRLPSDLCKIIVTMICFRKSMKMRHYPKL